MRAVLQRVAEASVASEPARPAEGTTGLRPAGGNPESARIGPGLLILLGVGQHDDEMVARRLADRCCRLRIFEDEQGKLNDSLLDVHGSALVVSQFTLCADTSRGRRPSFEPAARPDAARELYERFVGALRSAGVETATGSFGARMKVRLVNDGPVTIILDSDEKQNRGE